MSDSIHVECPGCGKKGGVPRSFAGRSIRCKCCSGRFIVPQPPPADSPGLGAEILPDLDSIKLAKPAVGDSVLASKLEGLHGDGGPALLRKLDRIDKNWRQRPAVETFLATLVNSIEQAAQNPGRVRIAGEARAIKAIGAGSTRLAAAEAVLRPALERYRESLLKLPRKEFTFVEPGWNGATVCRLDPWIHEVDDLLAEIERAQPEEERLRRLQARTKPIADEGLVGAWELVEMGVQVDMAPLRGDVVIIEQNLFTCTSKGYENSELLRDSARITIDPTCTPKQINLEPLEAPTLRVHGIYKLEEDRLTLYWNMWDRPRPRDFWHGGFTLRRRQPVETRIKKEMIGTKWQGPCPIHPDLPNRIPQYHDGTVELEFSTTEDGNYLEVFIAVKNRCSDRAIGRPICELDGKNNEIKFSGVIAVPANDGAFVLNGYVFLSKDPAFGSFDNNQFDFKDVRVVRVK